MGIIDKSWIGGIVVTFKIELIAPKNGWGVVYEVDKHYLVNIAGDWKPILLQYRQDLTRLMSDSDTQATEDISFETIEEAIDYIKKECGTQITHLPETTLRDLELIVTLGTTKALEKIIEQPEKYHPDALKIAQKELLKRQQKNNPDS